MALGRAAARDAHTARTATPLAQGPKHREEGVEILVHLLDVFLPHHHRLGGVLGVRHHHLLAHLPPALAYMTVLIITFDPERFV